MRNTVVPYTRFLEIRQRRQRVFANQPTLQPVGTPNDGPRRRETMTIKCEARSDEQCGTRPVMATGAENRVSGDYEWAGTVAAGSVRPGTARDRDIG
jgi:hypothetical protein